MKPVKRILILFGVLDLISVAESIPEIIRLLVDVTDLHWLRLLNLIIYASLLASGYYLIRMNKIGIIISYIQFPLRLLVSFFSLGFLMMLSSLFENQTLAIWILSAILVLAEIARLVLTIQIHRNHYRKVIGG